MIFKLYLIVEFNPLEQQIESLVGRKVAQLSASIGASEAKSYNLSISRLVRNR